MIISEGHENLKDCCKTKRDIIQKTVCPVPHLFKVNFPCHSVQNWEKFTPYNIIKQSKKSNIWFNSKHIPSTFQNSECIDKICCGIVQLKCYKMVILFCSLNWEFCPWTWKKGYFLPLRTWPNFNRQNGPKKPLILMLHTKCTYS